MPAKQPAHSPKFTAIVSSYNYQDYVVAAVESALAQSHAIHEVIVVDDGSTDDSVARLQAAFSSESRVRIIAQANAGQMAAWQSACAQASGELVALLDSDDLWKPDYLAQVAARYRAQPSLDYVYCNMEKFGAASGLALTKRRDRESRDLGLSVLLGACIQRWQGVASSGNTLRLGLLKQILALPAEQVQQWKTRPDDCLFYGSDILGGHKYYLAEPLVLHREHANNALLEFSQSPVKRSRYAWRLEKMLQHYRDTAGYTAHWLKWAKYEFRTKPTPSWSECWIYCGLAWQAPTRLSARLSQVMAILAHYANTRRANAGNAGNAGKAET